MTPRLYAPDASALWDQGGRELALAAEEAHYVGQVLRLRVGEAVELFDGGGRRFAARLDQIARREAQLSLEAEVAGLRLGALRLTLIQAVSAADKMDWTIEKATELGVARIQPVLSQRSKIRLDADRAARRHEHWLRVLIAASMQSQRDELPRLDPVQSLDEALTATPPGSGLVLVPPSAAGSLPALAHWSGPSAPSAQTATAGEAHTHISLLIGPESGLEAAEVDAALAAGFIGVSLGPRILRTETAGLAALAILQARFGDL